MTPLCFQPLPAPSCSPGSHRGCPDILLMMPSADHAQHTIARSSWRMPAPDAAAIMHAHGQVARLRNEVGALRRELAGLDAPGCVSPRVAVAADLRRHARCAARPEPPGAPR